MKPLYIRQCVHKDTYQSFSYKYGDASQSPYIEGTCKASRSFMKPLYRRGFAKPQKAPKKLYIHTHISVFLQGTGVFHKALIEMGFAKHIGASQSPYREGALQST